MTIRDVFENAGLVLGPPDQRAAALCRFAGRPGADRDTVTLAVVEAALRFDEPESLRDVGELERLGLLAHVWGYPDVPGVERPRLGAAVTAVAEHLQHLVEGLTSEQLREVGIALSVAHGIVALALDVAEESNSGGLDHPRRLAELEAEILLDDDRLGDAADVLVLDPPGTWPSAQRTALVLALVWDLADLIALAAELSSVNVLPTSLLWQAGGGDHSCASARVAVPGTDQLVWVKVEERPFEGRPLWSQAVPPGLWHWSLYWQREDGSRVHYKAGHAPSPQAARWRAEWATQLLLADPYGAKSPTSADVLVDPRRCGGESAPPSREG
ncbi:hypothetical protein ACIOG4_27815 [Streptomyces microflavus]|uniref:hypothetical protein n=1 Tax=Streptomyces microflavus TaxID=1919 RepID=UPI00380B7845